MPRNIRYMPKPHTVFEIKTQTTGSRLLLRPSREVNSLVIGVLGCALELHESVRLYAFVVMSNHVHMLVSAPNQMTLSAFMCYVNTNISKEIMSLYGLTDHFWGRRYSAIPVLDDEAIEERARDILSHGCKEGLVRSPLDWPGASSASALVYGKKIIGRWIDRTSASASRNNADFDWKQFTRQVEVRLSTLPFLRGKSEFEQRKYWSDVVQEIIVETDDWLKRTGGLTLGKKQIMRQNPLHKPTSPKKLLEPTCHTRLGCLKRFYDQAYQIFVSTFKNASQRLRNGEVSALNDFPPGSFAPCMPTRTWNLALPSI